MNKAGGNNLRSFKRAAALASAVGAAVVLASTPASASGGHWGTYCEGGRACVALASNHDRYWNFDGCGYHTLQDYFYRGWANGNAFNITYVNNTWDRVDPWTTRPLDPRNLAVSADILC
jgi:hypothetical protein